MVKIDSKFVLNSIYLISALVPYRAASQGYEITGKQVSKENENISEVEVNTETTAADELALLTALALCQSNSSENEPVYSQTKGSKQAMPEQGTFIRQQPFMNDRKPHRQMKENQTSFRQIDKFPKVAQPVEKYKSTRIKESESAERNLKKLLKVLNENLSFEFGGIPQFRYREQEKRKKQNQPDDGSEEPCYDDTVMRKDQQVCNPKASSPDSKKSLCNNVASNMIDEILKKEYRKLFKGTKDDKVIYCSVESLKNQLLNGAKQLNKTRHFIL